MGLASVFCFSITRMHVLAGVLGSSNYLLLHLPFIHILTSNPSQLFPSTLRRSDKTIVLRRIGYTHHNSHLNGKLDMKACSSQLSSYDSLSTLCP